MKMNNYTLSLLIFLTSLTIIDVDAQENYRINKDFNNEPLSAVFKLIESETQYHFYYRNEQIDTFRISLNAKNLTVKEFLSGYLMNEGYNYAIDSNNIFITVGREIVTTLPPGFFNLNSEEKSHFNSAIFDYMDNKEKEKKTNEEEIFEIGQKTKNITGGKANIAGYITDEKTGEPIIGAVIYHEKSGVGVVTNAFGYYTISLATGKNDLKVSCIGMKERVIKTIIYSNGNLDIILSPYVIPLKEVVIEAERGANVYRMQMGHEKLDLKTIKQLPMAMGEVDLMKAVLTLPGVKSIGESSTGLNVRGGATSQNLILLDDAVIYNPSHLFGFFSSFNPDVIKNIELYKSNMPAKYGGRTSSVLEAESKEGNKKKITGSGGLGLVTGRFNIEGPIIKDKMTFIAGGRTTYSDWLLSQLPDESIKNSKGSFYDLHTHFSYEITKKSSLYFTAYGSNDYFKFNSDTVYRYNNYTSSVKFRHTFSNQLMGVFSAAYSNYSYNVTGGNNTISGFEHTYKINQFNLKSDFSYYFNTKHSFLFGASSIIYNLHPGSKLPLDAESIVTPDIINKEQATENALYIEDQYTVTSKLSVSIGLRYSMYNYLGPNQVLEYEEGVPKDETSVIDTINAASGKIMNTYHGPELRVSARYLLPSNTSIKASYQKTRQYIHMLSNTTAISPTDIWKLSDPNILPEIGDQVSLGIYKNFNSNSFEISIEGYYKKMKNFLDYKDGAVLMLNHNIERDILNTLGTAYGLEFMLKRPSGKLNGWISYTFSRSMLETDGTTNSEVVNFGRKYPANYDKPQDFTFVGNYRFSRRFSISTNVTYSSGRPITLPLGKYEMYGGKRVYYSERNQFRVPDYFRTDFSMTLEGNHRIKKFAHYSWTFSIYNLTGRKNAYSVFFRSENDQIKGYKLVIFGQPIPTLTYNFRF